MLALYNKAVACQELKRFRLLLKRFPADDRRLGHADTTDICAKKEIVHGKSALSLSSLKGSVHAFMHCDRVNSTANTLGGISDS